MPNRVVGLIDCNNFFVSCERIFRPDLNKIPVVVMSNNDGCAIARSEEAKILGVKMGQPIFQIKDLVRKHNIQLLSPNFALYSDISNRVMSVLSEMVPRVEVYSVDECFLDFSDFELKDLKAYAEHINYEVYRQTGVPTCIGVASTKTLAKAANRFAKKKKLDNGVFLFNCENSESTKPDFLKELSSADLWGIGRSFSKWLNSKSVCSAYDFYELDPSIVLLKMKSPGLKIWYELHGISCVEIQEFFKPKKSIATTRTFSHGISDFDDISALLAKYASECAEKLRNQNSVCSLITIFLVSREDLHSKHYRECEKFYSYSFSFESATNFSPEIISAVLFSLKKIYKNFLVYKRGGVMLSGIEQSNCIQVSMKTDFELLDKNNKLMSAIDLINNKYGANKIAVGFCSNNKLFAPNQFNKSPAYTTNWDEILEICP